MKIIRKIQTFGKMMPVIEKDQLPNWNEPISAKQIIKQSRSVKSLPPREPIDENKLKFKCVCTIENAEKNYKKINRKYKGRYKKGKKEAVIELLERYPCFHFTNELWVIKALKEKPVKSGPKWRGTKIGLVDDLVEKGYKTDRAFRVLSGRIGIGYERIRNSYYDAKKNLINKPFAVSSISKSIGKHEPTDLLEYTFTFFKEGIENRQILSLVRLLREGEIFDSTKGLTEQNQV